MDENEITTTGEARTEREADRPSGPVAAAFIAAGVGSLVLGLLTVLAEASEAVKGWLEFSAPVGPLSGETILAVVAWLVAWAVLHAALRERDLPLGRAFALAAVLVGLGVLLTFPPIFLAFAPAE
ncbi:MAG TPA: hypothetical protein VNO79_13830 [Actinomycetota bacterium]|nr:hypothetical protein [Actinomycetota bacterium]